MSRRIPSGVFRQGLSVKWFIVKTSPVDATLVTAVITTAWSAIALAALADATAKTEP
jgi:hypothetical protein